MDKMTFWIPKNITELKQHTNNPLFKNAYFLILNTLLSAGTGLFLWIFAARFYSTEEVSLSSTIIAATGLLSIFSILGFDIGLIRYLPDEKNKREMINSCFTITALIALLLSIIFSCGLGIWSPTLLILRDNIFFGMAFIIFTTFNSSSLLQANVFVAFREAKYSFIQGLAAVLRIAILLLLIVLDEFGIHLSTGVASLLAFIIGNMLILNVYSSYKPIPIIKKRVVNDMVHYSSGNYIANIFASLHGVVLPIMVINMLSVETNAYFYIAWVISGILLAIPLATSMSLLAEGSFLPEELRMNVSSSLKFIFVLLVPAIIAVFLFGRSVLLLFGEEYARNSFEVLLVLGVASVPFAVNALYATVKKGSKEDKVFNFYLWKYCDYNFSD